MIQATGTIMDANGVSEYVNPLINIYMVSPSKYQTSQGVAQVGKVVTQNEISSFSAVSSVGTYNYQAANPSFEEVQNTVKAGLEIDYPNCTFVIVQ